MPAVLTPLSNHEITPGLEQVDPYETCMTLETLLSRYKEDRGVWRHQYKALIVHDYLLNHGSAIFVELSRKYKRYAWCCEYIQLLYLLNSEIENRCSDKSGCIFQTWSLTKLMCTYAVVSDTWSG